jgi:membrane associated rhomboid family serine protease
VALTCAAYALAEFWSVAFVVNGQPVPTSFVFGLNDMLTMGAWWWQPLSMMFVHGGLMHLAMNMVVLYQFGSLIEAARGWKFFTILYFAGGILTSLGTYALMQILSMNVNVVGASGAICVIIGWIAKKDSFNRKGLIIAILAISFLPLLVNMNVAWYAHLVGFAVGWGAGRFTR